MLWHKLKSVARQMRHEPTAAEQALWERLRNRRLRGFKFRRQHMLGRFIADFYCAKANLAIEVDGAIHRGTREQDLVREAYLMEKRLRVIRFDNDAVLNEMEEVTARISAELRGESD